MSLDERIPKTVWDDVLASFVVFLVALPLCMGIAMACGMPPAAGLITGIIGGIVTCSLGGCRLQVSGPAAGLVVTVADVLQKFGTEGLAIVLMLAGAMQLIAGAAGLAGWFRAVPPSVIHGMLSGIGVLIIGSQCHVMVDDVAKGSGINNLMSIPAAIAKAVTPNATASHEEAALIGLLTIVVLIASDTLLKKFLRKVPSSLVAIVIGSVVAVVFAFPIKFVALPENLLSSVHLISFPIASQFYDWQMLGAAFFVAFIASAETLLTAAALDKFGARTNYDRELLAQGLGNTICGAIGVLPMTGVMVRSGVNVTAGAKTRLSGVLHGVWLLVFVVFFSWLVRLIPSASLAALLVYAGWKLANFKVVKELAKAGRWEIATYVVTVSVIVATDLLAGVAAGVGMSLARLLYTFSHLEISVLQDKQHTRAYMSLRGAATFLSLPTLAAELEAIDPTSELHVHLDGLHYIDHACLDLLMNWDVQHRAGGGSLVIDWSKLGKMFRERRRELRLAQGASSPVSTTTSDV
jgi:MFS superfamily sulfate permease-like transporter